MSPLLARDLLLLVPAALSLISAAAVFADQRRRARSGDATHQGPWAIGVLLFWFFFPFYLWRTRRRGFALGSLVLFLGLTLVGTRIVLVAEGSTIELCPADSFDQWLLDCPTPRDLYHTGDTIVWRLQEPNPIADATLHVALVDAHGHTLLAEDVAGPEGAALRASGTLRPTQPGDLELVLSDAHGPIARRAVSIIGAPLLDARRPDAGVRPTPPAR